MIAFDNKFDLLIKGGEIVNHAGRHMADIGVTDGKITAIGDLGDAFGDEEIDAKGLTVLPGVIDSQVHFREPGTEHKEDLESGTRAAILGGVTAVFEMPNTDPATTTAETVKDKLRRAKGRMWCDHAFYIGATPDNARALGWMERLPGVSGVQVSMGASTGDLLVPTDEDLYNVLRHGSRRVAVHAEDNARLTDRMDARLAGDPSSHADWRDAESARLATERALHQARRAGRRVHMLHMTTGDEIQLLAQSKDIATVEVLPQHLTFSAPEIYERIGTRALQNPPIRDDLHRDILWYGLQTGVVDVIGSGHAPHTVEEKAKAYPNSPSGMPGVQTLVPVMLTHVAEGRLSLERLVDLTSAGPQRVFNLRDKGRMALGYDGDFTLVDLKAQWTITDDWSASRSGWTPFDGFKATGKPVGTIIRGAKVMMDGELFGAPTGKPIRFQETLSAKLEP